MSNERFEELVNGYSRQVLNVALRILQNADLANDVHQEVFLAIWRRWHKYNGQTNWQAYLYRTTVRKAVELAKRSRLGPVFTQQDEEPAAPDRPDAPARTAELQKKLTERLAELPKRQADVFVLSRMEGLQHEKIAEILGCSQNTVRVHLHRAMKRLARELSDFLPE